MFELRKIYEAWGYSNELLKESDDLHDILITLLIDCREYYGIAGFDFPRYEILINEECLELDCGFDFNTLNTDEKVINYVKSWYKRTGNIG